MVQCCASCLGTSSDFPRKSGEKKERTWTDLPFMVAFWGFVALMVIIILHGFREGNPVRLTHGADWQGRVCGYDAGVEAEKFMMFCGSPERTADDKFPKFIIQGSTVCVSACPTGNTSTIQCLMPAFHNFTQYVDGAIAEGSVSVPNVRTIKMTLTQSVTSQRSYPTELWGGRFCLPPKANPELRDLIIDGPWGEFQRPLVSMGSVVIAWPLLAIVGATALLLSFIYIQIFERFAGILVFVSMILSTLTLLSIGIMFFLAIFFDMDDTSSDYCRLNPILSVYAGEVAKTYSVITGGVLIAVAAVFGVLTFSSMSHIDETIGLIDASCKVIEKSLPLKIFPAVSSAVFLVVLVPFFVYLGLPLVASLGYLDHSQISINGKQIQGLHRAWEMTNLQRAEMWFYIFGILFVCEWYLQAMHFVVAYAVASWYFTEGTLKEKGGGDNLVAKIGELKAGDRNVNIRVQGVDPNFGQRVGRIVENDGQQFLVAEVQKGGPGLGRHDAVAETLEKKEMGPLAPFSGFVTMIVYHAGSIAIGCPVIWLLRPFRLFSQFVTGFLLRNADPVRGPAYDKDPHKAAIKSCLSLLSACMEQIFAKYSKTAWTEIILSGGLSGGFFQASENSFNGLIKAGGAISHLHGAMMMYEFFGCACITLLCTWEGLILQDKVDWFNANEGGKYPIGDKNASAIACSIVAFIVTFAFMSMWGQIADVLLYCLAWNRRQLHEGEESGLARDKLLKAPKHYAHGELTSLIPAHELSAHAEHGLHAHGLGQRGAILAAMEQGGMHAGNGAPDYGKKVAALHATLTGRR